MGYSLQTGDHAKRGMDAGHACLLQWEQDDAEDIRQEHRMGSVGLVHHVSAAVMRGTNTDTERECGTDQARHTSGTRVQNHVLKVDYMLVQCSSVLDSTKAMVRCVWSCQESGTCRRVCTWVQHCSGPQTGR